MDILEYCTIVEIAVRNAEPLDAKNPAYAEWFCDTGSAANALRLAIEGDGAAALRLAEPLAERYAALFG